MHVEWIKEKMEYVKKENDTFMKSHRYPKFSFAALMTMIENEDKRLDWVQRKAKYGTDKN
jgi:hypothetical protein